MGKSRTKKGGDLRRVIEAEEARLLKGEVGKEVEESMLSYAVMTILDRALPDARDGLKPVQRRIVYGGQEYGFTSGKRYVKSARIVGEILGKLHPHGDQSVYEAMVKLAQPWYERYPLMDFQGNRGSPDGDGAASMRYCVTGDTLIRTEYGLVRADALRERFVAEGEFALQTEDGRVARCTEFFDSGVHPVYDVVLEDGYRLRATENHPVRVLTTDAAGRPTKAWRTVDELVVGDRCAVDCRLDAQGASSSSLTEDEAALAGFFWGSGRVSTLEALLDGTRLTVAAFYSDNEFLAEYVSRLVSRVADAESEVKSSYSPLVPRRYSAVTGNVKVLELLADLGFGVDGTEGLSPAVLEAPRALQARFLGRFLEACGEFTAPREFTAECRSEVVATQLQVLLLQHGVPARRDGLALTFDTPFALARLRRLVTFLVNENKAAADAAVRTVEHRVPRTEVVPFVREYLAAHSVGAEADDLTTRFFEGEVSEEELAASLTLTSPRLGETVSLLRGLRDDQAIYRKVEGVFYAGEERVYSPRVDDDSHAYVGNGVVCHNTEAKLARFAEDTVLERVGDRQCVDFKPDYADVDEEPEVLPAMLPNFLVNGSYGIAVGYTTNAPSHNLTDVCNVVSRVVKDPGVTSADLVPVIRGPDFPLGGQLLRDEELTRLYTVGEGSLTVRGEYVVETAESGNLLLVFTSIPPGVNKPKLLERLDELIASKAISRAVGVRDESQGMSVRLVVECQPSARVPEVAADLYSMTDLQSKSKYVSRAVVGQQPRLLDLRSAVDVYLKHRRQVIARQLAYQSRVAERRKTLVDGLISVADRAKRAVGLITESESAKAAKVALMTEFALNDEQAEYVLDVKLRQLTRLDKAKLVKESAALDAEVKGYAKDLKDVDGVILRQLAWLSKTYGDPRRVTVVDEFPDAGEHEAEGTGSDDFVLVAAGGKTRNCDEAEVRAMVLKGALRDRQLAFDYCLRCAPGEQVLTFLEDGTCTKTEAKRYSYVNERVSGCVGLARVQADAGATVLLTLADGRVKKVRVASLRVGAKGTTLAKEGGVLRATVIPDAEAVEYSVVILTRQGYVGRFSLNSFTDAGPSAKCLPASALAPGDVAVDCLVVPKSAEGRLVLFGKDKGGKPLVKAVNVAEVTVKGRTARALPYVKGAKFGELVAGEYVPEGTTSVTVLNDRHALERVDVGALELRGREQRFDDFAFCPLPVRVPEDVLTAINEKGGSQQ